MQLHQAFTDNSLRLPAKVNFMLQKNITTLYALAQEIEKARYDILTFYGEVLEDGNIKVLPEKQDAAYKELLELFGVEQEVNIMTTTIDALGDSSLSLEQMNALMFMLED